MHRFFLLPVCIVVALQCHGQDIERKVVHKYTQADNLSSYNIRKIVQDKQGFIWIATQDGLNRFDGNRFDIFKKNAAGNKALLGVDIRDIIIDSTRNLVWVLSGQGGLNAIDPITGTVVRSIPIHSTGHEDWNISMTMTNGTIWIGSYKGVKVFDLNQEKPEEVRDIPGRTATDTVQFEARHITADGYGNIWAGISGYGIARFDGFSKKFLERIPDSLLNAGLPASFFRCYGSVLLKDGSMLFATSAGLRKVIIKHGQDYQVETAPCPALPEINTELVYSVTVNYRDEIIVSTTRGVFVFDNQLQRYRVLKQVRRKGEADWFNSVFCSYADRNNNLWLGCNEGLGFVKYRPEPLLPVNYDPASNRSLEHVHSIYPLDDNRMLVGLKNGLMLVEQEQSAFYPIDTANLYHHIYKDPKGVVHAVHSGGMLVYKNRKLLPVTTAYPELAPVTAYPVNSHLILGDSLVILGTENDKGIICWNLRKKTVRTFDATTTPLALAANIVNGLYQDSSGNIWVLADKAITIISPGFQQSKVLQYKDTSGQPLNIYFDMCEANGSYWIAAYGTGIVQLDSLYRIQRIISSRDGLSNDGVYKTFCPDGKKLIVTSNNGLSMLDLSGLRFSNFFENDGLHNNAFEEASGCMQNGIIYAGGLYGLTIINYRDFLPNLKPPVLYMRRMKLETSSGFVDTSHLFLKKMLVPNDVLQTTVYFSAQSYSNPSRTTFYYRINELHREWVYNGTQNFVNLIGINPGAYTLQVRAVNEDGVSSPPVELSLVFLPKWYQTTWFKILAALLIAASIYGLYRMRMAQLRREERIRRNIAGDLHDDLGSTLNSIKIFTNLALMKPDNAVYLQQAKTGVQNAIAGIRDMVWVLDDRQDTMRHLVERTDLFVSPLAAAKDIRIIHSIQPSLTDLTLGKEEKRNLYLIIKEAVNNSIKYAAPATIELTIKKDGQGALNISVSDDGAGFDANDIKKGNGLDNMALRANQIKYDFSLHSSPGKGTTILLKKVIPARYRFL